MKSNQSLLLVKMMKGDTVYSSLCGIGISRDNTLWQGDCAYEQ